MGESVAEHAVPAQRDDLPCARRVRGTNLSVGRGTPEAFQHIGAPWLNAAATVAILKDREIPGVRFFTETFTPVNPTDGKYSGETIPGIRIVAIDRTAIAGVARWREPAVGDSPDRGRKLRSTTGHSICASAHRG